MNRPLVSVIMPCYNAARWVGEAIESCLAQSYRPLEIILVDDGSTDGSGEILRRYASRHAELVQAVSQANRGAPAARNRGLAMSRGAWVQWLDADDLLLPGKIELQMAIVEAGLWDAVAGGWRELREIAPDVYQQGPLRQPEHGTDAVVSLISDKGWVPIGSWLFRRSVMEAIGGWTESRRCMQDVDLVIRVAMSDARITYVGGPCAFYRRPLQPTLSTRDRATFMRQCCSIYDDVGRFWNAKGWTEARRRTLCRCYGWVARYAFEHDRKMFDECLDRIWALDPHHVPAGPPALRWLTRLVGYRSAEQVALWYRRAKRVLAPSETRSSGLNVGRPRGPLLRKRRPRTGSVRHAVSRIAWLTARARPLHRPIVQSLGFLHDHRVVSGRLATSVLGLLESSDCVMVREVRLTPQRHLSLELPLKSGAFRDLAFGDVYAHPREGTSLIVFSSLSRAARCICDVGAHAGVYALVGACASDPDSATIVAFEPVAWLSAVLQRNVYRNHLQNVRVVNAAAGRASGSAVLYVPHDLSYATLHPEWLRDLHVVATVPTRVYALDEYFDAHGLPAPDLIKIDVEHEPDVLAGAEGLIRRRRPDLLVELLGASRRSRLIDQLIERWGYHAYYVCDELQPMASDDGRYQDPFYNFLFTTRDADELARMVPLTVLSG